jgi:hypothetical protein
MGDGTWGVLVGGRTDPPMGGIHVLGCGTRSLTIAWEPRLMIDAARGGRRIERDPVATCAVEILSMILRPLRGEVLS